MSETEKPIARLPTYGSDEKFCNVCRDDYIVAYGSDEEFRNVCRDDNIVVVIEGNERCNFCGNKITLCAKHAAKLLRELEVLHL